MAKKEKKQQPSLLDYFLAEAKREAKRRANSQKGESFGVSALRRQLRRQQIAALDMVQPAVRIDPNEDERIKNNSRIANMWRDAWIEHDPDALYFSYDELEEAEKTGFPIYDADGHTYTPTTYTPPPDPALLRALDPVYASMSLPPALFEKALEIGLANSLNASPSGQYIGPAPYRSPQEEARRQKETEEYYKKYYELKDLQATYDIMNNPYNPIGWIPGVRSMTNAGLDQRYRTLTGERHSPYTASAALSIGADALGLGLGFGSAASQIAAYGGNVAGGMIGEEYGDAETGRIIGTLAGGLSPAMFKNISNRFSSQGFRIGNNNYKLTYTPQGTLSSGGLGELGGFKLLKTPTWQLKDLPGLQIKSLFKGSPLEKLLSKLGTISLKLLQAYIGRNDVPAIDKELIGKVLLNHANDTHIDYNTLRQEVLDMIPKYNRVSESAYAGYGIDRLGFKTDYFDDIPTANVMDDPFNFNYLFNAPEVKPIPEYSLNTFTFESPNILGNDTHYNINTLGHSRTYTTKQDPDILYVMESLSDWAQHPLTITLKLKEAFLNKYDMRLDKISNSISELEELLTSKDLKSYEYDNIRQWILLKLEQLARLQATFLTLNNPLVPHMQKTYLLRLLQENLKYAAQNGQTKMRYPTPETAAKIEGYSKYPNTEYQQVVDDINSLDVPALSNDPEIRALVARLKLKKLELEKSDTYLDYRPEHKTILKKYADFPKQFLKLFGKQAEIRTVVDDKGNSWYEVDVPLSYLDGTAEILFKKGGSLVERFKKCNKKIFNNK